MSMTDPFPNENDSLDTSERARRVFLIGTKPKSQSKKVFF